MESVSNISQTPDERKGFTINVITRKWTLPIYQSMKSCIIFNHFAYNIFTDIKWERRIHTWRKSEETDSVNKISPCIKSRQHFLICCTNLILDKWREKGGGRQQCKGEQWILLNYIIVKSWSFASYHIKFDIFTIFQAFEVKADLDQKNREVSTFFFHAFQYIDSNKPLTNVIMFPFAKGKCVHLDALYSTFT